MRQSERLEKEAQIRLIEIEFIESKIEYRTKYGFGDWSNPGFFSWLDGNINACRDILRSVF
jgi:hypothetical protein